MTIESLFRSVYDPLHTPEPQSLTPKVSSELDSVTLLLLAFGPSENVPGPGRFEAAAEEGSDVTGESPPASEMDVGVAVCRGGEVVLLVREFDIL
jgi:hypothetical protein